MKTDTRFKILKILDEKRQARAHDLGKALDISQVAVHKQLKKLLEEGKISKAGNPPFVVYLPKVKKAKHQQPKFGNARVTPIIEERYLYVSPEGKIFKGTAGFAEWVFQIEKRTGKKQDFAQLAHEYVKIRNEADTFYKDKKWINAIEKMKNTFKKVFIDKVFYQDFYSLPKFGKTKLGNLVLYSKQSQNKELIRDIVKKIFPVINKIIKEYKIEAILFIPHSIPRKLQFLKYLKEQLDLSLPVVDLAKAYAGEVPVAQKSLNKLEDRIINAKETIFIKDSEIPYKNVLLIDDAVGSGATLNETAKKLKRNYGLTKVYGYAIVGSYKGFEVIKEI